MDVYTRHTSMTHGIGSIGYKLRRQSFGPMITPLEVSRMKSQNPDSPSSRRAGPQSAAVKTSVPHENPVEEPEGLKLDFSGDPTPLYQRVKLYILKRIESGEWLAGTRVPSENVFSEHLGISRMTINRALRELTDGGQLHRVQGLGTFVASRKPLSPLLEVRNIAEDIRLRGGILSSEVLILRQEIASDKLASDMELPAGSAVYHSLLVHLDRNIPVQIEERFVNPAAAGDYLEQDFTRVTPNQYLCRVAPLTEVEHVVEAILPDKRTRKLLKTRANEPCLLLARRSWSYGTLVTKTTLVYPGSRFQLGSRFKTNSGTPIQLA